MVYDEAENAVSCVKHTQLFDNIKTRGERGVMRPL